ncbi:MAG: zinc metallopeptidase [Ruminococcus sp.]|nr:zinc metallopeptidase [Ruminococcus sp.]
MFFGWFYYDWTILILIPPLILALIAQSRVNSTYKKYSQVRSSRGLTAHEVARQILDANGLSYIKIEHVSGKLTDNYDPKAEVIRLSDSVDGNDSVAAIGVAAHECGHAIQHAEGYAPIKLRSAMIPITNFGSRFSMIFIIIGLVLVSVQRSAETAGMYNFGMAIAVIGILLFSLSTVFQLVTLPVEFNASSRALKTLKGFHILEDDEIPKARKVLSAAAMTYVAALVSSLASLLRIVLIVLGASGRGNRRN